MKKPRIIIITGSTATGKSSLGIYLAKKLNGEIISADSRQIYRGLENFSGTEKLDLDNKIDGIKHHLISIVSPGTLFTASDFKDSSEKLIEEILKKNKTPIIVGGTAFYIKSLLYKNFIPKVEPNKDFRSKMEKLDTQKLAELLKQKDISRYKKVDLKNRRRIIRSLEVIDFLGYFPESQKELNEKYNFNLIELFTEKENIDRKIEDNFKKRVDGMLKEAKIFRDKISENTFLELGLAYKNIFNFWKDKITLEEFINLGIKEEQKYAKRQKTFLKKLFEEFPGRKKRFNITQSFLKLRSLFFILINIR